MKYKIGDKIRIKTWEKMKEEYGLHHSNLIFPVHGVLSFSFSSNIVINKQFPDRIFTICHVNKCYYVTQGMSLGVEDWMIECLIEESIGEVEIFDPITSRYDILDIRN